MYSVSDLNRYIDNAIKENRTMISDELSGIMILKINTCKDLLALNNLLANGVDAEDYREDLEAIIIRKLDPSLGIHEDAKAFVLDYLNESFLNCCGNEAFLTKADLREIDYCISDRIDLAESEAEYKKECLIDNDEV